jgi:hypothetical protein
MIYSPVNVSKSAYNLRFFIIKTELEKERLETEHES